MLDTPAMSKHVANCTARLMGELSFNKAQNTRAAVLVIPIAETIVAPSWKIKK